MSKKFLLLFAFISLALVSFAQTGKITGKVLNNKNEPLAGVSVKITGAQGGTTTDVDGLFTLNLQAGKKYSLVLTTVGYASKTIENIEVAAGQVLEQIFVLESSDKSLSTVTVTANRNSARRESTASLIQFQKNTNTVASVISAESIRRSPDKNTGEVLKRIPGSSIIEGKYLVVRGLSDRYNMAMLNGVQLSSTEPDRKTFSFDIFPAAMLDNIVINKAFVPEMSGEWAGGLIQINTRDIPAKNFFNVQVGTGFNTQTIGKDFYTYKGGNLDWMGIDDGARDLPAGIPGKNSFKLLTPTEKAEWGKKFPNVWSTDKISAPLNASLQASGGFNGTLFDKKVGGVFALTYTNNARRLAFDNNVYNISEGLGGVKKADTIYRYNNVKYSKDVLWGAMANFAVQLNNNNKISVKNIFNVNATDYVTDRTGQDNEFNAPVKAQELAFKSNTLFNTQLSGDHNFSTISSRLKWYGSFSILDQYVPNQRRLQYNDINHNGKYEALLGESRSQKSGNIFYSNLSDYIYTAGGDWSTTFKLFENVQTVKGGYLFQVKDRLYNARPFSIILPSTSDASLKNLPSSEIFAPEHFGGNGLYFDEYSESNFRYLANSILNAGYIQFDNQFNDWLRVVWGVRVEDFDQLVGSVNPKDPRYSNTKVRDWLPALNATFKLNNLTNIRLSASQTVVRPEFRELTNLAFYDFDLGATVIGNQNLKRTKITNLDLRYELYPRSGEVFTIGVFYKQFEDPIEQYFNQSGVASNSFNFFNAVKAKNYGAEIEFRKNLDFINGMKNFTFQSNIAYIHSRVEGEEGQKLDRPLQGQSPYVANASLQYDHEKSGISATLLYNQIGRRILFVGNQDVPEIWEASRPLLDFQIAKKVLNKKGEVRLNVTDIINRRAFFYHNLTDNENFKKNSGEDAIAYRRNYGTNVSITFGYNF